MSEEVFGKLRDLHNDVRARIEASPDWKILQSIERAMGEVRAFLPVTPIAATVTGPVEVPVAVAETAAEPAVDDAAVADTAPPAELAEDATAEATEPKLVEENMTAPAELNDIVTDIVSTTDAAPAASEVIAH